MRCCNMTSAWLFLLGLLACLAVAERIPEDQFGKAVFYERALDDDLTSECQSNTFCLDRAVSRGSCYHSDSDDTHIGNAILCDVSETECCGYEGCGDPDNRGNHPNGDPHNYYWYATGFRSGFSPFAGSAGGCCHCAAGCDFVEQDAERTARNVTGSCIYRDITSTVCQRATDQSRPEEQSEDRRIGHLRCPIPGGMGIQDATIREAPPPSSSPPAGENGGSGGNQPASTTPPGEHNAGSSLRMNAFLIAAVGSLLALSQPHRQVSVSMIPFALLFQSILASAHYVWLDLDGTSAKLSFREKPGGIAASLDWLAADTALWVQSVQSGSKALSMEKAGSQLLGNVQSPPHSPVYLNGKAYFGVYKALNVSSPPLIVYHYNTQSVGGRDGWDFLSKVQRQDEGIFMEPDSDCKSVFVSVKFFAREGAGTQVRVFDALGNTLHSFVHPGGDLQVKVEIPPSTTVVYVLASSTVIQSSTFKGEGYKQVNHYATTSLRMIGCSKDGSAVQLQQSNSPKASSVARWLVEKLNYGFLSTIETVEGKARPFGNVISFANGHNSTLSTGRLFFYASNMDRSGQDLVKESMCSFTLTEAQLDGTCSQTDAQDAICAKVIFTGRMGDVDDITDREFALESLFAKNPPMKGWPTDHNWRVMELRPSSIFVLFHYGGAEDVPPNDYYKALPQAAPGHFQQIAVMPTVDIPRPHTEEHEKMARWMVHSLSWGVLSTISTNLKGAPFGHVVSISDADASGRIFVYMTKMSPSLRDVDTNARVSLSLSEAQVVSQFSGGSPCRGEIAEEPTCARLTLSGKLVKVSASDVGMARNGVFGRHRTMWTWPKDHKFDFYELKVEDIFFIDFYGGVKPMSTKQYFSASVQNGINEAWGDLYLPKELFRSSTREQSSSMLPWLLTVSLAIGVVVLLFMLYERRKRTEYVQIEIKDSEKEGVI